MLQLHLAWKVDMIRCYNSTGERERLLELKEGVISPLLAKELMKMIEKILSDPNVRLAMVQKEESHEA